MRRDVPHAAPRARRWQVKRTCTGVAALLLVMTACGSPYDDGVKAYNEGRYEEAIELQKKLNQFIG